MRVCLIPLDERPATLRYPVLLGAIAGIEVITPPPELLGAQKCPMDVRRLPDWMASEIRRCEVLIVSCEALAHGGLIPSRISQDSLGCVIERLEALRAAKAINPRLRILGSAVISRIANDNHATEEPDYWADYGRRLHAYSVRLDRYGRGLDSAKLMRREEKRIPAVIRHDFHKRRLRNHAVNLAAIHLAAEGILDFLAVTSDDTSPWGLPAREKLLLAEYTERLGLDSKVLLYPGADEVSSTLVARVANGLANPARFSLAQVAPADAGTIPPFEDVPVGKSVLRQLRAAGADVVRRADKGDTLLVLNTPIPGRGVFDPRHARADKSNRLPAIRRMMSRIEKACAEGIHPAVADVAYANGADPVLIHKLFQIPNLGALHGYGGWNTAGNTLGTVIAQASCARHATGPAGKSALEAFTFHRLIEDWGYQHLVRSELRERLQLRSGKSEPAPRGLAAAETRVETRLVELARQIPGLGSRFRIIPGSVRLPWKRTFEVDFVVEMGG